MENNDSSQILRETVLQAVADNAPLRIVGGNSKAFYGRASGGKLLSTTEHCGIISYEPTELVIIARAGTPLRTIEIALAEQGQMLGFEPPHFAETATLGGAIACGLSGPRRPFAGSVRDFVLGMKVLNGKGEILRFGGQVIKNVAGYDLARLMTGALGTLGLILEVSLKVIPQPPVESTYIIQPCSSSQAIEAIKRWARKPYPLSAVAHYDKTLYVRLSGAASAVQTAGHQIGGERFEQGTVFWSALREQTHPFFNGETPLWRLSLPPATPTLAIPGQWLFDWGGAQRWLRSNVPVTQIYQALASTGGHVSLFRGGDRYSLVFHPLDSATQRLHHNLKHKFDPHGIFNPGRMYPEF